MLLVLQKGWDGGRGGGGGEVTVTSVPPGYAPDLTCMIYFCHIAASQTLFHSS